MAQVTAALIKQLRESSGAGMLDCKNALTESDGNLEVAADWLRTKGLATAAKKAGRVAAEGLVGVIAQGTKAAIVEFNSETDFVARNEQFQEAVLVMATVALEANGDLDQTLAAPFPGSDSSVADKVTEMISAIGENMALRRTAVISVSEGVISTYVHNAIAEGLGKIGVLVALKSKGDADKVNDFGKQLAMHIAATDPQSVSIADLDPEAVAKERAVLTEQAKDSGRPPEIVEKMIEGRLRKFYEEVVLLSQTFVIDGESKVEKAIEEAGKELGAAIEVSGFVKFTLGEGIEKKEEDFAAEVAAQVAAS